MKKLLALALVGAVSSAAAVYLQRPDAFTRVWLPLAGAVTGAAVEASGGRLTASGRIRAQDLRYRSDALLVSAARIELRVDPLSLLPWRPLVIHALRVSDGELVVRSGENGADSDDASPGGFTLPRVDELFLEDTTLRVRRADDELVVGPGVLTGQANGASPGAAELRAPVARLVGGEPAQQARLAVSLELAAPSERPPGATNGGGAPIRVESLVATLFEPSGRLARVSAAGRFASPEDFRFAGHVTFEDPNALLDLAGLPLGDTLAAGVVDGTLALERSGTERLTVRAGLAIRELRSARAGRLPAALALDARLQLGEGALLLDRLVLAPLDEGRPSGSLRAAGRLGGAAGESALMLTAEELPLGPWLALAGARLPERLALPTSGELRFSRDGGTSTLEGELRTRVAGASGAPEARLVLRPALQFGDPSVSGRVAVEGPGPPGTAPGRAAVELSVDTTRAPTAVRVDAEIGPFDLTPFRPLWTGASAEPGPAAAASAANDGGGLALTADVRADSVHLAPLVVEEGRLHLERVPGSVALRLEPTRLAGGSARADYARRTTEDAERVALSLDVERIDLPTVLGGLGLVPSERYQGRLDLAGEIEGRAAPGENPLERANGELRFEIDDAATDRTQLQRILVAETGLEEFLGLRVERAGGTYPIERGRIQIDELRLDGRAIHLVVTGDVGVQQLDLRVNPRIGPDLAQKLPTHLARWAANTVFGQIALPLVVVVEGGYADLRLFPRPALPSLLGQLYGGITGVARWLVPSGPPAELDALPVP